MYNNSFYTCHMNTGIIYRLTSPSGRKYIGQTTHTAERRWHRHEMDAIRGVDGCVILCRAIREYGFDNFIKEVIIECDVSELDFHEMTFIKNENTLTPNGYNIMPGGRNNISRLPTELQKFYSDNIRKHTDYELPPGLVEINLPNRDEHGFKVIIGKKSHTFISKHQTMEEKLTDAMECYNCIKQDIPYVRKNCQKWNKDIVKEFDLVEGIKYRADKGGFEVHVKGHPRKTFTKKKYTPDENLRMAKAHLASLKAV